VNEFAVGVASVGAGYTTFMASGSWAALVDFGAPNGRDAVRALERFSDRHPPRPRHWWPWWRWWPGPEFSEFVVSHPHADHYSGLLRLAKMQSANGRQESLIRPGGTFFYPMVPRNPEAQRLLFYLAQLNQVISSLPENVLGRAVAATSDGPIRGRPLKRGDEIELAGIHVDVLWPPPFLDERTTARLRNLVREYEEIAEEAAERGDERLIRALEAVREPTDDLHMTERLYGIPEDREQFGLSEIDEDFSEESERERPNLLDDPGFDARLRQLRNSISRGANLLSLVLATRPQRYVFLGDLDESLHPDIIGDLVDQDHELLLSAHHGTHLGPDLLRLQSRYVVSSVGPPRLDHRVRPNTRRSERTFAQTRSAM
jgi:ribonuclease BN (tRNA processing enzyme)